MTVVNPKSISGINSITTGSGSDNLLTIHTNNGTERLRIDSTGATKIVTGIVTTLTATTGIVTTLTANTVTANSTAKVGSGVTLSPDGDIFATGVTTTTQFKVTTGANAFETSANVFKGASGQKGVYLRSALSAEGTPSYSSVDDTNTGIFLPGSDVFGVTTGGSERLRITSDGDMGLGTASPESKFAIKGTSGQQDLFSISDTTVPTSGGEYGVAMIKTNTSNRALNVTNYNTAGIGVRIYTNGGASGRDCLQCYQAGGTRFIVNEDVTVSTGNLVIGTSGKGIDFSANTLDSAGVAAELLDDYEEGTFTPNVQGTGANNSKSYSTQLGKYTKIGNIVHCEFRLDWSGYGGNDSGSAIVNGLPFVIDNNVNTGSIVGALATNACNYPGSNTVQTAGWEAAGGSQYVYPLLSYDNSGWQNPPASSFWGGSANVRGAVTYRVS